MHFLYPHPIILASSSPRRRHILELAGFQFDIIKPQVSEDYPFQMPPQRVPEFLAQAKAWNVYERTKTDRMIIAADTLVFHNEHIIGKPENRQEAIEMLERLSGKVHRVVSGVALCHKDICAHFQEETLVHFLPLSLDEITYYVDEKNPLDKAGAYSIGEWMGLYGIEKIQGDYYNVLGLPMVKLFRKLHEFATAQHLI